MTAQQKYWEVRLIAKITASAVTTVRANSPEQAKQQVLDIVSSQKVVQTVDGYYLWELSGEPTIEVQEPIDATESPAGIELAIWDALGGDFRDLTESEKSYIEAHPALTQELLEWYQACISKWTTGNIRFAKQLLWKSQE